MFEIADPNNVGSTIMGMFPDNRATVHLHGNNTVWIYDGTPHQWITPADENTPYPNGVSVVDVPDMPDPGPGAMTMSSIPMPRAPGSCSIMTMPMESLA